MIQTSSHSPTSLDGFGLSVISNSLANDRATMLCHSLQRLSERRADGVGQPIER